MQYNLNRFITAQEIMYECALNEINAGKKVSHWMWYIFPQIKGLGSSTKANFYGIENLNEAKEYMAHPILGARLIEVSNAIYTLNGLSAREILGSPDDLKLKSSMTLFTYADASENNIFLNVLEKYYDKRLDEKTIELII